MDLTSQIVRKAIPAAAELTAPHWTLMVTTLCNTATRLADLVPTGAVTYYCARAGASLLTAAAHGGGRARAVGGTTALAVSVWRTWVNRG